MPDAPRRILGDFKLLRELGRGGMGVVYLARQLSLGREVALKLLSNEASSDPQRLLRFQREAALLARISHPNLVRVYVVGEDQGTHFLAMDFVDGVDLERVVGAKRKLDLNALPAAFRADWIRACATAMRDVAAALGAAHAQGIVHRDVKPSNVLLAKDGRALLADFGIARDLGVEALTNATGTIVGTPHYLSPEVVNGEAPSPRSDVHAVGAVLYEALAGTRAYDAPTVPQLLEHIAKDDPPPLKKVAPDVPKDLETIAMKCLEKDPLARYADGDALANDLSRFLAGEPIEAAAVGTMTRMLRRAQRRRVSFLVTAGVAAAAIGLLAWGLSVFSSRAETREDLVWSQLQASLANSDLVGARTVLDTTLESEPDREPLRFERAELALRERRWADAETDFAWLESHGSLDREAARLGAHLAARLQRNETPDAPPVAPAATARAAHYRSVIRQARKEFAESIAEKEHALALDPDCVEVHYELGAVHFRLRAYAAAEANLLAYSAVRPGRPDTWHLLGQIDLNKKQFDAAITNFERLVKLKSDSAPGWNSLAAAFLHRAHQRTRAGETSAADADRARAKQALDEAKRLAPDYFLLPFNEALLLCMQDRGDDALKSFRRAVELGGKDPYWGPQMWLGFIDCLIDYRQFDAARALLDELAAQPIVAGPEIDAMRVKLDEAADAHEVLRESQRAVRSAPSSNDSVKTRVPGFVSSAS